MKKLSLKDIVVYTLIASVGLGGIWIFLETNIIIDHGDQNSNNSQSGMRSNFNNLNSQVQTTNATVTDDKVQLLDEEIEKQNKQLQEERAAENRIEEKVKLNDVSAYMNEIGRDLDKEREKERQELLKKMKLQVSPSNHESVVSKQIPVLSNNSSQIKKTGSSGVIATEQKKGGVVAVPKKRRRIKHLFDSLEEQPHKEIALTTEGMYSGKATVYGPQTVDVGKRLTLLLEERMKTPYGELDAGTLIDGYCSFSSAGTNRLIVKISTIKVKGKVVKVNGKVLDYDGMEGIPLKGLTDNEYITKNTAGQAVNQAASKLGIPLVGQSIQSATQKKLSSSSIPLTGDEKILVIIE